MKKSISLVFLIFTFLTAAAQRSNEANFINFRTLNLQPSLINPAFTGFEHRTQIDFQFSNNDIYNQNYSRKTSPSSTSSFEHFLPKQEIGLGLRFINHNFDFSKMSSVEILISKRYAINDDLEVSFGLNINNNRETYFQHGEPVWDSIYNPYKINRTNQFNADLGLALKYKSFHLGFNQISLFPATASLQWGTIPSNQSITLDKHQYRVLSLIYNKEFSEMYKLRAMGLRANNLNRDQIIYNTTAHLFVDYLIIGANFHQSVLGDRKVNNINFQVGVEWDNLAHVLINVYTLDLYNFTNGNLFEFTYRFYFN